MSPTELVCRALCAILFHHTERFEILAWVIMPNHVHVLLHVWRCPLARILQNWKSITARQSNQILNRQGRFWQTEYWDRFMRDSQQQTRAIRYIENNPVRARLCRSAQQ